jgi:two-component system nitrate/nitrite response regulator NarL
LRPVRAGLWCTESVEERARIVIVDDHMMLAETVAAALAFRGHEGVVVVEPVGSIVERVIALAPELVLLDLDLGAGGDGLALVGPLCAAGIRVAVVSANVPSAALEAGAVAVLDKAWPFSRLVVEVERIVGPPQVVHHDADLSTLTASEAAVLGDLLEGRVAAEIATNRNVAVTTVRTHIRSILSKLGVQSQVAAVAVAQKARWSPPLTSAAVDSPPPRQS